MAEQSLTLQPAESKLVSFEAIPHEARTYIVRVNGLTGSFKAIALPPPPPPPPPPPTSISGVFTLDGVPMGGIYVFVHPLYSLRVIASTYTDSRGRYSITGVDPFSMVKRGAYGIYGAEVDFNLKAGQAITINLAASTL